MRKLFGVLFSICLIMIATVSMVQAGTDRTATKDTTCFLGSAQCADGFGVAPAAGNLGGTPSDPCIDSQLGYMAWDLSGITQTIGSAELTLSTYNVTGISGPLTFELFAIEDASETWGPDDVNPPTEDTSVGDSGVLATNTATLTPGTTPQTVVFGGAGNTVDADTLGNYFETKRPATSATVGIRIADGCSLSTVINFEDANDAGGTGADPDLIMRTGTGFTAIEMSSWQVASSENALLAGTVLLVVVTLILGTGMVFIKRQHA